VKLKRKRRERNKTIFIYKSQRSYQPCVHFVNAIPISLICLFSSVKNYIALSLSLSYTSRVMAFKGLSKYFFFHWDMFHYDGVMRIVASNVKTTLKRQGPIYPKIYIHCDKRLFRTAIMHFN